MPSRHVVLTLIGILSIASDAFAADIMFKRVEADGSVTFTDQPLQNAEITVGAPISVIGPSRSNSPAAPVTPPVGADGPAESASAYPESRQAPATSPTPAWRPAAPLAPPGGVPDPSGTDAADSSIGAPLPALPDTDIPVGARLAPTASPDTLPISGSESEPASAAALPGLVTDIRIASPHDGAMLVDRGEPATLQLDATLTDTVFGDALRTDVLIDGDVVASGPLDRVTFPLPERGTHVLAARVTDAGGRVLAISASQTVHVKKARSR